jgi:transposase
MPDAKAYVAEPKKRTVGATERDEFLRLLWREELGGIDPSRVVFVDEMGTHTSLAPVHAYAPVGERAYFEVPRNRGKNTTLIASLHAEGMGPSMAVEGGTTSRVFEAYVERVLAPALEPGQVVVMDKLGAHRPQRIRELIEERGCELLYLPSYSPDLNPIEEAFAKVKHLLREVGARTKDALIEAMGRALGAVSSQDVRGFFVHCGYRTPAQRL